MRTFLVFGGTGAQGGSVIHHVATDYNSKQASDDHKYKFRVVTRDPESQKAKEFVAQAKKDWNATVEYFKGTVADIPALHDAFKGVHACFVVTQWWDPALHGKEFEQGKSLTKMALDAGVERLIWSGLPNVEEQSGGKIHAHHFTDKGKVTKFLQDNYPHGNWTSIEAACYFENFLSFFGLKEGPDGVATMSLALSTKGYLTGFSVADYGNAVVAALNNWNGFKNKVIPLAAEHAHPQDLAKVLEEVLGRPVRFQSFPTSVLPTEMGEMFKWFEEHTYYGKGDITEWKKLGIKLSSFHEFAIANKDKFLHSIAKYQPPK